MPDLNETPRGNRIRIAFFGLRNAGKSTLVNAFTGQSLAIVSDVPGTTTDPVSKAMEILPLGPCLVTDTAGLDDAGELGARRVRKSLDVLATTDIAVWVRGEERAESDSPSPASGLYRDFLGECRRRNVMVFEYRRGDSVEGLKAKIAAAGIGDPAPGLLDGLVSDGDRVVCVAPIDESAPKGRLILPQQQTVRECLERHLVCTVCQPDELSECLEVGSVGLAGRLLVITDSQAFGSVRQTVERFGRPNGRSVALTSFSVLFARQKGDIAEFAKGLAAIRELKDGDTVLVAEGCTHHRQCNDIGSVKIPKALGNLSGRKLNFAFASGTDFEFRGQRSEVGGQTRDGSDSTVQPSASSLQPSLIVHCGGCMLTRREILRRIGLARASGVPIVNYGMVLAAANGLRMEDVLA